MLKKKTCKKTVTKKKVGSWSLFGKKSNPKQSYKITKEGKKHRVASFYGKDKLWSISVGSKKEASNLIKERKRLMKNRYK
jgi:hypothetical protein